MFVIDDLAGVIRIEANIKKKLYLWYLRPIYIQSSPKGSFILTHVKSKAIIPFSRSLFTECEPYCRNYNDPFHSGYRIRVLVCRVHTVSVK